jgi:hypothetical protein
MGALPRLADRCFAAEADAVPAVEIHARAAEGIKGSGEEP